MPVQTHLLNAAFNRCYLDLVKWCQSHIPRDLGDPEDFVHAAYLRCRHRWRAERQSKHFEAAYFRQAVRWVVLDALRRQSRHQLRLRQLPCPETRSSPLQRLVAGEAITRLRGRQWAICTALLAGKSELQIRKELNLTSGALAVHLHRAKVNLCRSLEVSVAG